jgi:valyl-tRNA synthetase
LGWPNNYIDNKKIGDLARFHSTQLMETGYEIITLWVSRMIMMSLFALNEIPFSNVYLHGMVLDQKGKKMSKSKGNGIDPLDMIKLYGTDAVRLSLLIGTTPGNDTKMFEEKIAGYRNFVNKLWNISRFILTKIKEPKLNIDKPEGKTFADKWILFELEELIAKADKSLNAYDFSSLGEDLKEFTWNKLADWYLEMAKVEDDKAEILNYILNIILKLWHPFMPFVTESLWQEIYNNGLLMVESWPIINEKKVAVVDNKEIELVKDIIISIRNARAENKIVPAVKIKAVIYAGEQTKMLQSQVEIIKSLRTNISSLIIKEAGDVHDGAIAISLGDIDIYLIAEIDPVKEKVRLEKEIENLTKVVTGLDGKLSNQEFIAKAPPKIIKQEREKLNNWQLDLQKMKNQLEKLQ